MSDDAVLFIEDGIVVLTTAEPVLSEVRRRSPLPKERETHGGFRIK
jgi:hypothetical protein